MIKKADSNKARAKRHARVRAKISGTPERPRLNVYRSTKHIYAQLIDDVNGVTLASASSMDRIRSVAATPKLLARLARKSQNVHSLKTSQKSFSTEAVTSITAE